MLDDIVAQAESRFSIKLNHNDFFVPPTWHPETKHFAVRKTIELTQMDITDCYICDEKFLEIRNWFEDHDFLVAASGRIEDPVKHLYISPLRRMDIQTGYHATDKWSEIIEHGFLPATRERCTSGHLDTLGNSYVVREIGNRGDFVPEELNTRSAETRSHWGTAHWWREYFAHRYQAPLDNWKIIKVKLSGIQELRLFRDQCSESGFVLRTKIPPGNRIELVI